ncbi:MAG: DUF2852 domain-containing protein [Gammaproteobacteria bacterium]|nr:DUF2852 domain-containing protein [Gammaproteobacteria bacterium]
MSSTHHSHSNHAQGPIFSRKHASPCGRGHWSAANIFAMVVGFMLFPPLGLGILFWTLAGYPIQDLPGAVRSKWEQYKPGGHSEPRVHSDNVVFREYQQTQYDRIHEIKEEIRNRAERFHAWRANARRRADQEEFDSFMSSNPENRQS